MILPKPMKTDHEHKTENAIIALAVFGFAVSLALLLLVKRWWITVFGFILSTLRNPGFLTRMATLLGWRLSTI